MPTLSEIRSAHVARQRSKYNNMRKKMTIVSTPRSRSSSPRKSPRSRSSSPGSPNLYGRPSRFHISKALVLTLIQIAINILALYYISKTRMRLSPENALKYRSFALENFRKFKNIIATRVPAKWRDSVEATAASFLSVTMRRMRSLGNGRWSWANYGIGIVGAYGLARMTRASTNNFIGGITRYNNSIWGHISGSSAANAEQMAKVMAAMLAWIAAIFREAMVTNVTEVTRLVMARNHIDSLSRANLVEYGQRRMHLT